MITGIVLVIISVLAFYYVYTTDIEETLIEHESFGSLKLYLGILIIFIIGITSILGDL